MSGAAAEPVPAVASEVFGDRLDLAARFATHLATSGVEWGLLGPRELPRLWSRHVLNCAVVAELIGTGQDVVDIGSGAGLPGLAIAVARPDLRVTLVEPLERRVTWLEEVVRDLGVDVPVVRARADDVVGDVHASVVTARAVAPLSRLVRWGLPLVRAPGELLAIKGRGAPEELAKAVPTLRRLRADAWDIVECGVSLAVPTTVVRVRVGAERGVSVGARGGGRRSTRRERR